MNNLFMRGLLGAVSISALSPVAFAQTPAAAPADAGAAATQSVPPARHPRGSGLEEVVVTAQRRRQNPQQVPIATATVNAESAAKLGITDAQSLVEAVPGLTFNRQAAASIPFLRAVGTPVGQAGDEPSVAYYVDDVYYPSGSASLSNFPDISRIEVEKGPQGTLFGRNATGGVVQVFTKDPTDQPAADMSLGYANYNTISGSAYFTGKVAEGLAANLTLYGSNQGDGWGRNQCAALYSSLGCKNEAATFKNWDFGGRFKLKYTPRVGTTILFTADYDSTYTQEGLGFHAFPGTTTAGFPAATGFYDPVEDEATGGINRQSGLGVKITQDFDWGQIVNVTSHRHDHLYEKLDEDAGPLNLLDTRLQAKDQTWTEELRVLSPDRNSRFTWIAGFFYYHDKSSAPYTFEGALIPVISGTNNPLDTSASDDGIQITNSYSGFAQVSEEVLPQTHLTGGVRYTLDERTFNAFVNLPSIGQTVPASNNEQSARYPKVTFRFALDHRFTPDILGYIAFNRGFKSGVFNTVVFPVAGAPTQGPVAPEVLDAYTFGFKSEFFNHRLRFNTEAFYYDYKNIQINSVIGAQTILSNAAAAVVKGVDVDLAGKPIPNLTLNVSAEALSSKYSSFPQGVFNTYNGAGNTVTSRDLAGHETINAPPFTLTASASYEISSPIGPFSLTASEFHGGNSFFDPDNGQGQVTTAYDKQPVLDLVNLNVGYTTNSGKYSVDLFAKNLTGQKYYSFVIEDAFATQYSPAPPRTYGLVLHAHI